MTEGYTVGDYASIEPEVTPEMIVDAMGILAQRKAVNMGIDNPKHVQATIKHIYQHMYRIRPKPKQAPQEPPFTVKDVPFEIEQAPQGPPFIVKDGIIEFAVTDAMKQAGLRVMYPRGDRSLNDIVIDVYQAMHRAFVTEKFEIKDLPPTEIKPSDTKFVGDDPPDYLFAYSAIAHGLRQDTPHIVARDTKNRRYIIYKASIVMAAPNILPLVLCYKQLTLPIPLNSWGLTFIRDTLTGTMTDLDTQKKE